MKPEVNAHGVYEDATEVLEHTTPSGAQVRIILVQCVEGWREGAEYKGQWCGGGYWPNVKDRPHDNRASAVAEGTAYLARQFGSTCRNDLTEKEIAQRDEVIDWCNGRGQQELFE